VKELYIAASGSVAAFRQLELVSNNLANAGTHGYREARVGFTVEGPSGLGKVYATPGQVSFDRTDGELEMDGVATHLAIRGDAFFALDDGSFTRNGAFRVDEGGQLVTEDGTPVAGEGGAISLDPRESIAIGAVGTVTGSKSGEVGRLSLVRLGAASPLGGTRWSGTGKPIEPGEATVVQGALEGSNVDAMRAMVEMIEASRFFDAQQKVVQSADAAHQRLNRIGGS
jgi:flagellar basal-body rod protein FlgF